MATDDDVAFPTLSPNDLAVLQARGHPRAVRAGETLFSAGDRRFDFYVVLEGSIEIHDPRPGGLRMVTVHRAGQFSGDVDMLSGRAAVVTARVGEDGRVLQLSADELRQAVDQLPQLGETIVKAFLMRRQLLLNAGFSTVEIIGSRFSPAAHRLRDFATRNLIPFSWRDVETDEAAEALLRQFNIPAADTPVVLGRGGKLAKNPTLEQFAHCAGLTVSLEDDHVYDLVVVGAGPAGLAASVYAASEGLDVLTADAVAPGGQAGTSARIENYLGFPAGISGKDLTRNALTQAQRFGAKITVPCRVESLGIVGGERVLRLDDGTRIRTRCVLVASGVKYRRLDVPRFAEFESAGIYYAATEMEARLCRGESTVVVGGGNSAGQAVVHLARSARHVDLLVRGPDIHAGMSRYLVDQVRALGNVTVHQGACVTALEGDGHLARVRARGADGRPLAFDASTLFLFIGADPNTDWLRGCVELDRHGFVVTGTELPAAAVEADRWRLAGRRPFLLETSLPGVFAAGDVRSGSVKRCASAVGEGSMAVSFVHTHIQRPA
jgi:thioredoxin reductase (NADPH)